MTGAVTGIVAGTDGTDTGAVTGTEFPKVTGVEGTGITTDTEPGTETGRDGTDWAGSLGVLLELFGRQCPAIVSSFLRD